MQKPADHLFTDKQKCAIDDFYKRCKREDIIIKKIKELKRLRAEKRRYSERKLTLEQKKIRRMCQRREKRQLTEMRKNGVLEYSRE